MRDEAQTVVGEEWGSWDPETRITGCMMRLLRDCGIRPAGSSPSPAAASPAPRDARVSWAVPQSLAAAVRVSGEGDARRAGRVDPV